MGPKLILLIWLISLAPAWAEGGVNVEAMAGRAADQLFDRGVLGVVVVGLVIALGIAGRVILVLYRYAISLQKEMAARDRVNADELKALAVDTAKGLTSASATAAALAIATAERNRVQQQMLETVMLIPGNQDTLAKALDRNGEKMDLVLDRLRVVQ